MPTEGRTSQMHSYRRPAICALNLRDNEDEETAP